MGAIADVKTLKLGQSIRTITTADKTNATPVMIVRFISVTPGFLTDEKVSTDRAVPGAGTV